MYSTYARSREFCEWLIRFSVPLELRQIYTFLGTYTHTHTCMRRALPPLRRRFGYNQPCCSLSLFSISYFESVCWKDRLLFHLDFCFKRREKGAESEMGSRKSLVSPLHKKKPKVVHSCQVVVQQDSCGDGTTTWRGKKWTLYIVPGLNIRFITKGKTTINFIRNYHTWPYKLDRTSSASVVSRFFICFIVLRKIDTSIYFFIFSPRDGEKLLYRPPLSLPPPSHQLEDLTCSIVLVTVIGVWFQAFQRII
jgi:hypothetical protein